jgi:putative thioredoxin
MMESVDYIVDVTPDNFQQIFAEESMQRLIVVDFWADWCEPCKTLMPLLEKLANEYQGQFMLAKVDCEEQQAIAAQFGVRNLPTVALVKEGRPVDGFAGAQPESAIREMLEKYLPKPWEEDIIKGQAMIADGQAAEAIGLLKSAYDASGQSVDIAKILADAYLECKRLKEAKVLIDAIPMVEQDAAYQALVAKCDLIEKAAETPEIQALVEKITQEPENLDYQYQLALQYYQSGRVEDALDGLIAILTKSIGYADGAVRASMVEILSTLGKGDPLAVKYQQRLFTLMY